MFSKFFIERPRFALVISILMILAGLLSISKIPVASYPQIAPPQIQVSASYSGASAKVIADTVAIPIESQINGIDNILYFDSTSDNSGEYSCSITFKTGSDPDMNMVNTQNALKLAESQLPDEVVQSGITIQKRTNDMLAVFTFKTDKSKLSDIDLTSYISTNVKDTIQRVDGVSSASVMSSREYSMRIWLDPLRMAGIGISTSDVADAIENQNVQAAAGNVGADGSNDFLEYKIDVQGRLSTPEEFGDIIIRNNSTDGSVVHLSDIARIELGSKEYSVKVNYNGEISVGMAVYRDSTANALSTMNRAKAKMAELASRFPDGVTYEIAYDPTQFIMVSLKEIISTLVIAILLVIAITYLFLQDWRATLIPACAIPVSLLATFPVMLILGYSINILTMFGMILVIGSLVDDAIVVVENTQGLIEREGLSAREAAIKSMKQITGAVIATTLVTVACYVPLAFYGGMVGEIYTQFSFTMCIALIFSTIVALTLSPMLCSVLLRKPSEKKTVVFRKIDSALDKSRSIYARGVHFLVRRIGITALIMVGVLGSIYYLYGTIPTSFLPAEDKGSIMCNIELPAGASLARTSAAVKQIEDIALKTEGVKSLLTVTGHSMMSGNGENTAMAIVKLTDWSERTTPELQISAIQARLQQQFKTIPSAKIVCFTPPAIMGLGITGGLSFMLSGTGEVDAQDLSVLAKKFAIQLNTLPDTLYAMTNYNADSPQIRLQINRQKAEMLGVAVNDIFSSLQSNLASKYINDFNFAGDSYDVRIQSGSQYRRSLSDIHNIQVRNDDDDMIPLTTLADLSFTVGPRQIERFNKMVSANFNTQSRPGVSSGTLMTQIEGMDIPKNFHIEWTGMSFQEKQNEGQIVVLMALALLFAYLFLVAQYESWTIPLPVMFAVSFAVLGALIGIKAMTLAYNEGVVNSVVNMSIYAQLGLVMLIGLSAKNAILMVEFSKNEREQGMDIATAALNGAKLRFRAVLMTAFSFIFGVFPLVIATGAGAASRQAIGITTFSGMLLATFVGIFFTPALYALFQRLREFFSSKRRKKVSQRIKV